MLKGVVDANSCRLCVCLPQMSKPPMHSARCGSAVRSAVHWLVSSPGSPCRCQGVQPVHQYIPTRPQAFQLITQSLCAPPSSLDDVRR